MKIFSIGTYVEEAHHQSLIMCNPGYIAVDTYNKINLKNRRMYYLVVKWRSLDGRQYSVLTFNENEVIHGTLGLYDEQEAMDRHNRLVEDLTTGKIVPIVNRVEDMRCSPNFFGIAEVASSPSED